MRKNYSNVDDCISISRDRYDINTGQNKNNITLFISSKDRDKIKYGYQSRYSIPLNPEYRDIISIELISARIPESWYNITEFNSGITFTVSDTRYTCSIVPGRYTTQSVLISAIIESMNAEYGSAIFSGDVVPITELIVITGTTPFELNFEGNRYRTSNEFTVDSSGNKIYVGNYAISYPKNSIGKLLGFQAQDYLSTTIFGGDETITADWPAIINDSLPIALFLNKRNNFGHIDSSNSATSGSFCIFEKAISGWYTYSKEMSCSNGRYIKYFSEPLASLRSLDFELVDLDGNPYQSNGKDHILIFEIKSLNRVGN